MVQEAKAQAVTSKAKGGRKGKAMQLQAIDNEATNESDTKLSFNALTTTLSIQQLAIENNPTPRVDPHQASARVTSSDDQDETPRKEEKDKKDADSTSAKVATRPRRL
ncbi:uncharacterized protein UHO2_00222 [Ustilago hordei]|uniref:uncharacterized protein n=1 Tax=Ustilago hordei TaxID=120017 RepID=UPI001A59001F|nr:uncharacterized protein UHO2_00222 [Ustilago hordei]SYW81718.1 uncharacterized protein UHO2_00222 [Ustilago hordei]